MEQFVLDLDEGNIIIDVEAIGRDLRLAGWEPNQFLAESVDEHSLRATKDGSRVHLRASSDCSLRVPRRALIRVQSVGGDAKAKALAGKLEVDNVGGDLTLRQTGAVTIGRVGGDLKAKKVAGPLSVASAGGDVSVSSVEGPFQADAIGADLYLRDIDGPINAQAGSDIALNVEFHPGLTYELIAGGDITCRLSPAASVRFEIEAGGDINVELDNARSEGERPARVVTVGGGQAAVSLQARGDVYLTGLAADPDAMGEFGEHFGDDFGVMAEEFAAQIETQIESQMADFEKQMSERLASLDKHFGPGSPRAEEIAARARGAAQRVEEVTRRKIERRAESAQRKVEAARRKVEHQAEHARRIAEAAQRRAAHHRHAEHGFRFEMPRPPMPPRPPTSPRAPVPPLPASDPVTEEERIVVLRMVEQGKISVGDAEQLLAALENR